MLTLERCRTVARTHGITALDWLSRDIQEALRNCRAFGDAGIAYDRERESEYCDELCIVAQVRREVMGKPVCQCCGQVLP